MFMHVGSLNFLTTIGIDYKLKTMVLDSKSIKLSIWDTAGQEKIFAITRSYFRGAHGMMLVYDCTDRGSFENVRNWLGQIEMHADLDCTICLLANKCDSPGKQVPDEEGEQIAADFGLRFFPTSAKSNVNIDQAFTSLVRDVERKHSLKNQIRAIKKNPAADVIKLQPSPAILLTNKGNACC